MKILLGIERPDASRSTEARLKLVEIHDTVSELLESSLSHAKDKLFLGYRIQKGTKQRPKDAKDHGWVDNVNDGKSLGVVIGQNVVQAFDCFQWISVFRCIAIIIRDHDNLLQWLFPQLFRLFCRARDGLFEEMDQCSKLRELVSGLWGSRSGTNHGATLSIIASNVDDTSFVLFDDSLADFLVPTLLHAVNNVIDSKLLAPLQRTTQLFYRFRRISLSERREPER